MNRSPWRAQGLAGLVVLCALCHGQGVHAQLLRDPMAEPPGVAPPLGREAAPVDASPLSVIVVDGRPHVIMGTRLYAPGQMLGQARIERITDTEIWLREGTVLRKIYRFQGVVRRAVPAATAGCAATGSSRVPAAASPRSNAASCADVRP